MKTPLTTAKPADVIAVRIFAFGKENGTPVAALPIIISAEATAQATDAVADARLRSARVLATVQTAIGVVVKDVTAALSAAFSSTSSTSQVAAAATSHLKERIEQAASYVASRDLRTLPVRRFAHGQEKSAVAASAERFSMMLFDGMRI